MMRPKVSSASLTDDVPGAAVGTALGEYRLVEYLGRGGMADVYIAARRGANAAPGERFAVKRFLAKLAPKQRLMELFLHEAKLATLLSHPNLVRGIDFGVAEGVPFLVLELVEGLACDSLQRWSGRHRLPARLALLIVQRVLEALEFVHAARDRSGRALHIVHHDVSPDNILISRLGHVKLSDFGVARSSLAPELPGVRLRGKVGYMSPEQVAGLGTDARSDLFSAGVVLADLLLGRRLFDRGSELELLARAYECEIEDALGELECGVRDAVEEVLLRALAREPAARYQSATALQHALAKAAERLGDPASEADLAVWMLERGLLGDPGSGVHRAEKPWEPSEHEVAGKIERAPLQVVTAAPELAPSRRQLPWPEPGDPDGLAVLEHGSNTPTPVSLAELVERVVTGRAHWDTPVARGDGTFAPVHAFPPVCFLARKPAYRFGDDAWSRAAWKVPFERAELPSILFGLARTRARGLLSVREGSRHKRVFFERGSPCFVASTDPSELFGRRLVSVGLMAPADLDRAVALAAREGRRLGDLLVALGSLSAGQVLHLLIEQLDARVLELGSWVQGEIAFTTGVRPGTSVPRPLGAPASLPCRIVRHCYSDAEIAAIMEPLRGAPLGVASIPRRDPIPLSEVELGVLCSVPAHAELTLLEQYLEREGMASARQAQRALFLALSAGIVESPAWRRPALG